MLQGGLLVGCWWGHSFAAAAAAPDAAAAAAPDAAAATAAVHVPPLLLRLPAWGLLLCCSFHRTPT